MNLERIFRHENLKGIKNQLSVTEATDKKFVIKIWRICRRYSLSKWRKLFWWTPCELIARWTRILLRRDLPDPCKVLAACWQFVGGCRVAAAGVDSRVVVEDIAAVDNQIVGGILAAVDLDLQKIFCNFLHITLILCFTQILQFWHSQNFSTYWNIYRKF